MLDNLKKCPVCNGVVSPAASKCVHCGHPLRKAKKCRSAAGGWWCLIIAIFQPFLTAPFLDKMVGGDYDATGIKISVAISIGFIVACCVCFTSPSKEE